MPNMRTELLKKEVKSDKHSTPSFFEVEKSLQGKNVRNTVPSLNLPELSCQLGGDFTTQVLQTDRQTDSADAK